LINNSLLPLPEQNFRGTSRTKDVSKLLKRMLDFLKETLTKAVCGRSSALFPWISDVPSLILSHSLQLLDN